MSANRLVECPCGNAFTVPVDSPVRAGRCFWCESGEDPAELAGQWDAAIAALPELHVEQQRKQVAA